jgi:hypothetical protein
VKQRTVKQVRILQSRCSQRDALRHLAGCHQARHSAMSNLRASAVMIVLRVLPRGSAVRPMRRGAFAALSARRDTGAIKLLQQMR